MIENKTDEIVPQKIVELCSSMLKENNAVISVVSVMSVSSHGLSSIHC